jgi:dimethylhistidine N-methyltransferase
MKTKLEGDGLVAGRDRVGNGLGASARPRRASPIFCGAGARFGFTALAARIEAMLMTAPKNPGDEARSGFATDVRRGLSQVPRSLPPRYFYDALGSLLFEAICRLPWYPITRAEHGLLGRFAGEMVGKVRDLDRLVELGCGSGDKVAQLAAALEPRERPYEVHLVDVSAQALELSESALARLPHIAAVSHCATYEAGLRAATETPGPRGATLVLFLGSNIGNFDPPAARRFIAEIRAALRPGDGLLLGTDLVRAEADLLLAYADPLGVTAAFNKNVLLRMNAELGADFDLAAWDHRAIWNAPASRVEMHLVSRRRQRVRVPAAEIEADFAEGQTIWTESSYKYTPDSIAALGRESGLRREAQWIDPEAHFSTTLFLAED